MRDFSAWIAILALFSPVGCDDDGGGGGADTATSDTATTDTATPR